MKTAVEWLVEQLDGENHLTENEIKRVVEKAKEMEKQKLEQFYNHAMWALADGNGHGDTFEDYYNETFKSETIVTEFKDGTIKVETFKSE